MSVTRKIQVRRGTASQWSTANPVLSSGEFGYDTTNKVLKIGDGSTAWASLAEAGLSEADIQDLINTSLADYATTADVNAAFTPINMTQIASPTTVPTLTEGSAGAITGTVLYTVSFITADGETETPRNIDGNTVLPSTITVTGKRVLLSDIPIGPPGVIARRIWRGDNTGYNYRKLAVINDNTTTTYEDNEPFGLTTDLEPRWNSTGGYIAVNGYAIAIADPSFTAFGYGQSRTSNGENNSLFGYRAGASLEDGYWNSLFGSEAGESITSGYENSYYGYRAGKHTTLGWYNSGFGMGALEQLETGGNNSALGRSAGGGLVSGGSNCFMGYGAGQRMTTATNSIFIGENSANFLNDGTTSFTDCDFGIYIGNNCKGFENNEQNAIVIGDRAKGLGTNTTVLGSLDTSVARIYGAAEFRSGVGNITAINVNSSDVAVGRLQMLAGPTGLGYLRNGLGGNTYDALTLPATNAGLITFGAHVSFAFGNWQMSNEGFHRFSFNAGGTTTIRGHSTECVYLQNGDGENILALDRNTTSGNFRAVFQIFDGSTRRLMFGAPDSDGVGFRRVRILN